MTVNLKSRPSLALGLLAAGLVSGCDPAPVAPASTAGDIRRDATVAAVEQALPSVVSLATTAISEYRDPYLDYQLRFFGKRAPVDLREGLNNIGSGVIIDESGYLLTSLHVLTNKTFRIQVKLANGDVYDAERCVDTTLKDIALLRIKDPQGKKFKAIKFANDDDLLLGESVIALGNPYGLGGSVTRGILSSKNRRPSAGDSQLYIPDWLQTDADINPGNSGGPLVNLRGEMIGINARVLREGEGMGVGFAIPAKQISAALSEFFTPEAANECWFGARIGSFNAPLAVTHVQARSPAEKAGLLVGQRIVSVNGVKPRTSVDFHRLIMSGKDLKTRIEVETKGARHTLTVQMISFVELFQQRLGLALRRLSDQEAAKLNIARSDALLIERVEPDGPAGRANFQPGFLVTAFDERKTAAPLDAAQVVITKQPGERIKIAFAIPLESGTGFGTYNTTLPVR